MKTVMISLVVSAGLVAADKASSATDQERIAILSAENAMLKAYAKVAVLRAQITEAATAMEKADKTLAEVKQKIEQRLGCKLQGFECASKEQKQ